jgi:hypothetical protein
MLFWIYWAITAALGGLLVRVLIREQDSRLRAQAAMILVPVILRVLLIK